MGGNSIRYLAFFPKYGIFARADSNKRNGLIYRRKGRGGGGGGSSRGSRGSNEPPLEVNNGGLKTQTVDFQLLANSGGMENKL